LVQVFWISRQLNHSDQITNDPPKDTKEETDIHDNEDKSDNFHHVANDHEGRDVIVINFSIICKIVISFNNTFNFLLVILNGKVHDVFHITNSIETSKETHQFNQIEKSMNSAIKRDNISEGNQWKEIKDEVTFEISGGNQVNVLYGLAHVSLWLVSSDKIQQQTDKENTFIRHIYVPQWLGNLRHSECSDVSIEIA
jgi:hypothetical protein